jgi:hypothetical protein
MPDANPISGPYTVPAYNYTSADAPNTAADYSRTVRVTGSLNNPLTLTGSYANNAGFIIMNTGSVYLTAKDGTQYVSTNFHQPSTNHQVFNIALSYVSASAGGDITILYYQ